MKFSSGPWGILGIFLVSALPVVAAPPPPPAPATMDAVLAASKPSDWRSLDPENTLYLELPAGRVIIELAPSFAPEHVANIKLLAREHYYDGLAVVRSQDNYVVQWADPNADNKVKAKPLGRARASLPPEFTRRLTPGLPFTRMPGPDGYAPEVGFSGGFPAAEDPKSGRAWLCHCYGMVGVGRDNAPTSGSGAELYAVIGQAPRHLDRNVALVGRVVSGMEILSTLPRGKGTLGFYTKPEHLVPILSVRLAADLPPRERTPLEVLRTGTPTFAALVESRRNRREPWFAEPAGYVSLCNVPIPVRPVPSPATK